VKSKDLDLAVPIAMPKDGSAVPHGVEFSDDFSTDKIGNQWSFFRPSGEVRQHYRIEDGALVLRANGTSPKDSSPLTFVTGDHAYEMEVEIELGEGTSAGLMVYYNERLFAGLGMSGDKMLELLRGEIQKFDKPGSIGRRFFLRLRNDHHVVTVWHSADGKAWTKYWMQYEVSGYHHNVAGGFLSLRPALYAAGSGEVRFRDFKYRTLP
jgi:beta-xylosidase